jgi:hypothetical protein
MCGPLRAAPDQRIDLAAQRLLVEVDAELVERGILLLPLGVGLFLRLGLVLVRALGVAAFHLPAALADAVADEADRVERLMSCCCRK